AREPDIAKPGCTYGFQDADVKYIYDGIHDCRAAMLLDGGTKVCPIGCLGLGTCVRACPFDALSMGPDNLPLVNEERCTGCGTCERVCPKHIITLSSHTRRFQSEYTTDECTAPCQRTCPTGIHIPGFIKEIAQGNFPEALLVIKEKCPLPLICGYICPAPCELECRRNHVDEGVAINPLKRFVADYEMTTGQYVQPFKGPEKEQRIALVGGGAEGLTAGYYLASLGYKPTIFEAKPQLGGILRYVIAEDRLPRRVLDHDIEGILRMGVQAKTGMVMGSDFTMAGLFREGYDAVLLTGGGYDSRKILLPGQERFHGGVEGIYVMLDVLSALNQGASLDLGKHVVIVDTSLKGLELARKCRDLGADRATIVAHEPLSSLPLEMGESKKLKAEGIDVRSSATVSAIGGVSDRLAQVFLEITGPRGEKAWKKDTLDADTLIASTGRLPELVFVRAPGEEDPDKDEADWQTVETFRTFPKGGEGGIFAPPEPGRMSDASAVVKAILSGRRLTRAVHQYFTDESITPIERLTFEAGYILDVTDVKNVQASERQCPAVTDVEGAGKIAWIFPKEFPGLDEAAATMEAERCLQCGLICYRKTA
ncbi:MAG: FAD-dependent oxidoreductase, partial [Deltaproteobacteria bacterium]|nr:FAD-dependent oxidoreductase [Deltaproteobacteria bacterium]